MKIDPRLVDMLSRAMNWPKNIQHGGKGVPLSSGISGEMADIPDEGPLWTERAPSMWSSLLEEKSGLKLEPKADDMSEELYDIPEGPGPKSIFDSLIHSAPRRKKSGVDPRDFMMPPEELRTDAGGH